MIVKLIKPTPLIDHVAKAGEYIDGDKLLKYMVSCGCAVLVEGTKTPTLAVTDNNPNTASETQKPAAKTSSRKKSSAAND